MNETAATVNGTAIKLQEVEKVIKQQSQGQENKFSPLELAQARLQVLEQLIQQEVMYQKAQKEETIPNDGEVTAELNNMKTGSGVSKEEYEKRLKEAGMTEEDLREQVKKQLAISKLFEKVTGKVEPPSDNEIQAFYNGNKEAFVKKRGVKLATIVVDPVNSGQGDTTTDEASSKLRLEEIYKRLQSGVDFSTVASEHSEDPSRLRKGDLGYISEEQLKQTFSPQIAEYFMNDDQLKVGNVTQVFPFSGKFYIFKLQERIEQDENLTLESQEVRQRITDSLVNARKQLLQASYAAVAMDEAEIVNYLAQKVVENPNELSGARPASANDAKPAESSNTQTNTGQNADAESNGNAASETKSETKSENTKPEADTEKPSAADNTEGNK